MTTHDAPPPWPTDWVHGAPVPAPATWDRPGLALVFNLECAGCVARAVPWLRRVHAAAGDAATLFAVHSAYGHRVLPHDAVVPQLERFASGFARLPYPVALDLDGTWAQAMGAEGTPHWFVWSADGVLERSVYGSQDNALTRLTYLLESWGVPLEP